ncbi:unnamed protein product [Diamesa serratosioi]
MNVDSSKRTYDDMIGPFSIKQEPQPYSAQFCEHNQVDNVQIKMEYEDQKKFVNDLHRSKFNNAYSYQKPRMNSVVHTPFSTPLNYIPQNINFQSQINMNFLPNINMQPNISFKPYLNNQQNLTFKPIFNTQTNTNFQANINMQQNTNIIPNINVHHSTNVNYPVVKMEMSEQDSEDKNRTNFILSDLNNMSPPIDNYDSVNNTFKGPTPRQECPTPTPSHDYPTPSPSPKEQIKEPSMKGGKFQPSNKHKLKQISPEVLKELGRLKAKLDHENYGSVKRYVDVSAELSDWAGKGIYYALPPPVKKIFDQMMLLGYEVKNELLDLLNRMSGGQFVYNPNMSHTFLEYDKITILVIRALNNIASRRSRSRKQFANRIRENCLEIDLDENRILRKQEAILQEMIKKVETKFLAAKKIDHKTLMKMRQECGLE